MSYYLPYAIPWAGKTKSQLCMNAIPVAPIIQEQPLDSTHASGSLVDLGLPLACRGCPR